METTKPAGSLSEAAGKVQQAAGNFLDDAGTQVSAKASELGDKAQRLYTDFAGIVRESTVERPFTTLAMAVSVGFLLGTLRAANRPRADGSARNRKDRD